MIWLMARSGVARALEHACGSEALVRIRRTPKNADAIDGFVVGAGAKWLLLAQISDGGYFDGYVAIRRGDIAKVAAKENSFEGRFSRTQLEWPPRPPAGVDLDNTAGLVASLGAAWPLIGIEQERRFKSAMQWIGTVDEVADGWLWLREARPDATWSAEPLGYKLGRITKVEVGDRYKLALAATAGAPG